MTKRSWKRRKKKWMKEFFFSTFPLSTDFLDDDDDRRQCNANVIMGIFHAPFKLIYVIECEQWEQKIQWFFRIVSISFTHKLFNILLVAFFQQLNFLLTNSIVTAVTETITLLERKWRVKSNDSLTTSSFKFLSGRKAKNLKVSSEVSRLFEFIVFHLVKLSRKLRGWIWWHRTLLKEKFIIIPNIENWSFNFPVAMREVYSCCRFTDSKYSAERESFDFLENFKILASTWTRICFT